MESSDTSVAERLTSSQKPLNGCSAPLVNAVDILDSWKGIHDWNSAEIVDFFDGLNLPKAIKSDSKLLLEKARHLKNLQSNFDRLYPGASTEKWTFNAKTMTLEEMGMDIGSKMHQNSKIDLETFCEDYLDNLNKRKDKKDADIKTEKEDGTTDEDRESGANTEDESENKEKEKEELSDEESVEMSKGEEAEIETAHEEEEEEEEMKEDLKMDEGQSTDEKKEEEEEEKEEEAKKEEAKKEEAKKEEKVSEESEERLESKDKKRKNGEEEEEREEREEGEKKEFKKQKIERSPEIDRLYGILMQFLPLWFMRKQCSDMLKRTYWIKFSLKSILSDNNGLLKQWRMKYELRPIPPRQHYNALDEVLDAWNGISSYRNKQIEEFFESIELHDDIKRDSKTLLETACNLGRIQQSLHHKERQQWRYYNGYYLTFDELIQDANSKMRRLPSMTIEEFCREYLRNFHPNQDLNQLYRVLILYFSFLHERKKCEDIINNSYWIKFTLEEIMTNKKGLRNEWGAWNK